MIADIPGREDPFYIRHGAPFLEHVAIGIEIDHAHQELRVRNVPDGHEHAAGREGSDDLPAARAPVSAAATRARSAISPKP